MQIEKEVFIEHIESTVADIKEKIEMSQEEDINNNKEVRKTLLNLVLEIRKIKEEDIKYYDELIRTIPYVKFFEEEVQDLNQTKEYLSTVINSVDSKKNQQKFAELMKSSEIYYFINKKTKKEFSDDDLLALGDLGLIKEYLKAIWPSAKQEELLSILIYINSGEATEDYINFIDEQSVENKSDYLYAKFKDSLSDLYVSNNKDGDVVVEIENKSQSKISSANRLDSGVIINKELKTVHIGFATSEYATFKQEKQFFEKMSSLKSVIKDKKHELYNYKVIPTYLTNSLFNEHDIKVDQREHKKVFLNSFEKKLTQQEKNKINCLSLLSIVGNIGMNDSLKLDIEDFISINPYVAGADTLWIHNKFKKLSKIKNKNDKLNDFRSFLIGEAFEVLSILDNKLNTHEIISMDSNFTEVFKNIENIISASMGNFNALNLNNETLYNKDTIENLSKLVNLYEKVHIEKFNGGTPSNTTLIMAEGLYGKYITDGSIVSQMQYSNNNLLRASDNQKQKQEDKIAKLKQVKYESLEYSEKIVSILVDKDYKDVIKNREGLTVFLSELIENIALYPSRDANKLLSQISNQSVESRNFIQKYKSWKENDNFTSGVEIIDMLIQNASKPQDIIDNLSKSSKVKKFK